MQGLSHSAWAGGTREKAGRQRTTIFRVKEWIMKSWFRLTLAVGLVVCCVSIAFAQAGGGGRGGGGRGGFGGGGFGGRGGGFGGGFGGGGGLGLLNDENVRKDLGVTEDQMTKVQEVQQKAGGQIMAMWQGAGLQDLSDEERTAKMTEIQKKSAEISAAAEKEVLLPKQIERLKQITIQSQLNRGGRTVDVVSNGDLAKELGITDAQKEALTKAQEAADAEMTEKVTKIRDEARQKVLSVLTAEQQAKLKKLSGEPITFTQGRGGFGGFGGFGGGGPGGPGGGRGGAGGRPGGGRPLSRPAEGD
jgi:hypothetical protein